MIPADVLQTLQILAVAAVVASLAGAILRYPARAALLILAAAIAWRWL